VFQGKYLPPVTERVLGKQADLREAVEHNAARPDLFEPLDDELYRFAKLQIRRVQQALVLIRVQQAFRRNELENVNFVTDLPPVRRSAGAQLPVRFRERDVKPLLARLGAFEEKAQRNCGLASAGIALKKKDMSPRQAAGEDVVQTGNASAGLAISLFIISHRRRQSFP
jgi:hypothetical protein